MIVRGSSRVLSLTLLLALGPSTTLCDDHAEKVALEYAKSKHEWEQTDPRLRGIYFTEAVRLFAPDLCGVSTRESVIYRIDVPALFPFEPTEVVLVDDDNAYSLVSDEGFTRWLRDNGVACKTKKGFLDLVQAYLALLTARSGGETPLSRLCEGEKVDGCREPVVKESTTGFLVHVRLDVDQGLVGGRKQVLWDFRKEEWIVAESGGGIGRSWLISLDWDLEFRSITLEWMSKAEELDSNARE